MVSEDPMMISIILFALVVITLWLFRSSIADFLRRFGRGQDTERILSEDALKFLYNCEIEDESPTLRGIAGQLQISMDTAADLLSRLHQRALVKVEDKNLHLTAAGAEYALHVIRAHRLWERYLADRTGVAEVEWHGRAEKLEHKLSREQADELWAQLGHPTHDPHGDPLPTSRGSFDSLHGVSLQDAEPGRRARVIHVEDEPESVYAKLVALGIFPGMELRVLSTEPDRIRILLEGSEKRLDILEAANVTLGPYIEEETDFASMDRLSDLKPGEKGKVALISRASRGTERRRFMDLGILPGTVISAELESPGGDPIAYRVRGALLALRRDQAENVLINRMEHSDS
jgi:DtxR family Mn-dependent transcriptional regulator